MRLQKTRKVASIVPIFKKEDQGNYRSISQISILRKTLEHIIKQSIGKNLDYNKMTSNSLHGFVKSKSHQINLIFLNDRVTGTVDWEEAVNMIYLDFSKPLHSVEHDIFSSWNTDKLNYWVHNCLENFPQRA